MTKELERMTPESDYLTSWMTIDKVMSLNEVDVGDVGILGKALWISFGTESGYETEGGTDEPENWKRKPMEEWTANEVLDWIFCQAAYHRCDLSSLRGEMFQDVNGRALSQMKETEFVAKDGINGALLYHCLLEHKRHNDVSTALNWTDKLPIQWSCNDVLDWIYFGSGLTESDLMCLKGETFQGIDGQRLCSMDASDFELRDHSFGITLYKAFQHYHQNLMKSNGIEDSSILVRHRVLQRMHSSSTISPSTDTNLLSFPLLDESPQDMRTLNVSSSDARRRKNPAAKKTTQPKDKTTTTTTTTKRSNPGSAPGAPNRQPQRIPRKRRANSSEDLSDDEAAIASKTPKQSSKTRLWKFMRDLLDNPEYNPECIRWEDKEEGIFRIVAGRSHVIAKLWGKIKNNPTMTFDKLGRSLRWCRANNGKFSAVPKDGKFPRKLCFRLEDPDQEDQPTPGEVDCGFSQNKYGLY